MHVPTFPNVQVVGMHIRGEHAKAWAQAVQPDTEVFVAREPDNEYDPSAIKVMWGSPVLQHMGYIERGQAAFIAPWIDEGHAFTVTVTHSVSGQRGNVHPVVTFFPIDEDE